MGKNSGYNQTNQQVDQAYQQEQQGYADMMKQLQGYFGPAWDTGRDWMNDAYGKYNDLYGKFGDVASSGLRGEYAPTQGFYSNLMKTGGFSPKDISSFRAEGLAPTTGYWNSARDALNNQARIQNTNQTLVNPLRNSVARQAGQNITSTARNVNNDLTRMVQEGKRAGAEGLFRGEGAITSNMLAGMQGQMGATGGIAGLGEKYLGLADSIMGRLVSVYGEHNADVQRLLALKAQLNPKQPGFFERLMQFGSMAANMMTGGAAMGLFRKSNNPNPSGRTYYSNPSTQYDPTTGTVMG